MADRLREMYEAGRQQALDDGFKAGIRHTVRILHGFFAEEGPIDEITEEWFAHIVRMEGRCGCELDYNYDSRYDLCYCDWYQQADNRRAWYLKWHGMTEEQLKAKEKAEAEEKQRKAAESIAREKQRRLKQLHELAKEFGVDERWLP